MGPLYPIAKYIPRQTLYLIYTTYVRPILDYGDIVYVLRSFNWSRLVQLREKIKIEQQDNWYLPQYVQWQTAQRIRMDNLAKEKGDKQFINFPQNQATRTTISLRVNPSHASRNNITSSKKRNKHNVTTKPPVFLQKFIFPIHHPKIKFLARWSSINQKYPFLFTGSCSGVWFSKNPNVLQFRTQTRKYNSYQA